MKKALLFLAIVSHITLSAGFLDDLIGKEKAFLEANGFKCTEFSCVTKGSKLFQH